MTLLNEIKKEDDNFNRLVDRNFMECLKKIRFFIGDIVYLKNHQLNYLSLQIKRFYAKSDNFDSLVDFNYTINIKNDQATLKCIQNQSCESKIKTGSSNMNSKDSMENGD